MNVYELDGSVVIEYHSESCMICCKIPAGWARDLAANLISCAEDAEFSEDFDKFDVVPS